MRCCATSANVIRDPNLGSTENGAAATLLVQRQRHSLFGAREVDPVEILGRSGRDALRGRAQPHLDGRFARLADVPVVQRPVAAVGHPCDPLRTSSAGSATVPDAGVVTSAERAAKSVHVAPGVPLRV